MSRRIALALSMVLTAVTVVAWFGQAQSPPANAGDEKEAIRKSSREYAEAFNKGDAKAIAAMWTENGEYRDEDGEPAVGRAAIEKLHAEFFKANPGVTIELLVKSIRFPSKDLAVEEGLVRQTRGTKEMPTSTSYVAIHVREGGAWKLALSSEAGGDVNRLENLEWLLGEWTTKTPDGALTFAFTKDEKKPVITGTFTKTPTGKEPVAGSVRIAFDPELGTVRSWGFEDDGAHSQGVWSNDGKSWLIEIRGVLGNGTPFSETIVLRRVGKDAITWRAIDRILDGEALADTPILKLTRAAR